MLAIQQSPDRVTAFMILEIACLISLTSLNINVSLTAAHCLRFIGEVERFPNAPLSETVPKEERTKRYPIYDQIGDPKIPVLGRVAHQKRIRKLVRLIASPNPVYIAVWEECFTRARLLGDTIKVGKDDSASDDVDSGVVMSPEVGGLDKQRRFLRNSFPPSGSTISMAEFDTVPRGLRSVMCKTGPGPPSINPDGPSRLPSGLDVQFAEPRRTFYRFLEFAHRVVGV